MHFIVRTVAGKRVHDKRIPDSETLMSAYGNAWRCRKMREYSSIHLIKVKNSIEHVMKSWRAYKPPKEKTVYFSIRTETATHVSETRFPNGYTPRKQFARYVQSAVEHGYERVQLIRISRHRETVIDSWVKDAPSDAPIFEYKIHSLPTAQSGPKDRSNDRFYPDLDSALKLAEHYASRSSNPQAMVIYKAIKIVRPAARPVTVEDLD